MARTSSTCLLLVHKEHWTLYRTERPEEPLVQISVVGNSSDEASLRLQESLAEHQLERAPLVVALESDLCLACHFEVASPRQARNREALSYQLEEPLPVAAEEVTAAFVVDGVQVLGVCCQRAWLQQLLEQLSLAGANVRCVSPLALLATSELIASSDATKGMAQEKDSFQALWVRPDALEKVKITNRRLSDWHCLPPQQKALQVADATAQLAGASPIPRIVLGEEQAVKTLGLEEADEIVKTTGDPCLAWAALRAEKIARGETGGDLDLLSGVTEQAGRFANPLAWEQLAWKIAALLLLTAALSWQWTRGEQARQAVLQIEASETDLFRETFPDKRVPLGIRTRLESELRRIAGTHGNFSETPEHADAVFLLEQLLGELPSGLRYRLLELRIESSRLYLVGEVRTHSGADKIAAALRRAGLSVSPPSTQQLSGKGVEFRLTAERASPSEQAPLAGGKET